MDRLLDRFGGLGASYEEVEQLLQEHEGHAGRVAKALRARHGSEREEEDEAESTALTDNRHSSSSSSSSSSQLAIVPQPQPEPEEAAKPSSPPRKTRRLDEWYKLEPVEGCPHPQGEISVHCTAMFEPRGPDYVTLEMRQRWAIVDAMPDLFKEACEALRVADVKKGPTLTEFLQIYDIPRNRPTSTGSTASDVGQDYARIFGDNVDVDRELPLYGPWFRLSARGARQAEEIFQTFDKDRDGCLKPSEYLAYAEQAGADLEGDKSKMCARFLLKWRLAVWPAKPQTPPLERRRRQLEAERANLEAEFEKMVDVAERRAAVPLTIGVANGHLSEQTQVLQQQREEAQRKETEAKARWREAARQRRIKMAQATMGADAAALFGGV
jgi:hypothetical protein